MNKETFQIIFELTKKQPWVAEKSQELMHLLWNECDTEEKRTLLLELIDRFEHITQSRHASLVENLANNITSEPGLLDSTTQVVAMAADSSADSSQYILYELKIALEKLGWRAYKQINRFGRSYNAYTKNSELKNIVLIDELIGSGNTALNRVNELKRTYHANGIEDINIYVKVITTTLEGKTLLENNGISIQSLITLEKGITDFYPPPTVTRKAATMKKLEEMLSKSFQERDLPSFGYGQAELLYTRDGGNTPNSVFPIFWWPFLSNETERPVLLTRAMGDA